MDYITIGRKYYVGYCYAISVVLNINPLEHYFHKDCYKILFLESGTTMIQLNRSTSILTGPSVVCLNETDEIIINEHSNTRISIIYFHPSVINNRFTFHSLKEPHGLSITDYQDLTYLNIFGPSCKTSNKIFQLNDFESKVMAQRLQLMEHLLKNQDSVVWPCRCRSYLFEILFALSCMEQSELTTMPVFSDYSALTGRMMFYLHSCYNQKVTLETLCQEFHTNRTTLVREFKNSTGKSIHQYLMQLRLSMASTLLRDTELSVEEICDRCGFSDLGYFGKTFKKEISFTPKTYRQLHRANNTRTFV